MKIRYEPKITFSEEERKIADFFCGMCDELNEKINDELLLEDLLVMLEENIRLPWNDFVIAIERFTSFIASQEE